MKRRASLVVSLTRWIWVWVDSGSWWWTGRPGVLQSMGSQSRTRLSDWTGLKCNEKMAEINQPCLPSRLVKCGHDKYTEGVLLGSSFLSWSQFVCFLLPVHLSISKINLDITIRVRWQEWTGGFWEWFLPWYERQCCEQEPLWPCPSSWRDADL